MVKVGIQKSLSTRKARRTFSSKVLLYNDFPVEILGDFLGHSSMEIAKYSYGKLIKQILPGSAGWDGTFIGIPMPTSDYWFAISYIEPRDGLPKIFRAHFALKR